MTISPVLRSLLEEERQLAYEAARQQAAGPEIDASTFQIKTPSKFPWYVVSVVYVLCFVVLLAAFVPSATRLFIAGSSQFCDPLNGNGDTKVECRAAGYATILLAETGQIVFLLGLAVISNVKVAQINLGTRTLTLPVNSSILWVSAILSTLIAIIGNIHVSQPWLHGNWAFAYLETMIPPVLVMSVGYVLKELMLHSIERRHQLNQEMDDARATRLAILQNPKSIGEEWWRLFSLALRDQYRKANGTNKETRKALSLLTKDEWKWLVKQEMLASDWTVKPDELTSIERIEIARLEQEKREQIAAGVPIKALEAGTLIPAEGGEIWPNEQGLFTVRSAISGEIVGTEYAKEGNARIALRNHNKNRMKGS